LLVKSWDVHNNRQAAKAPITPEIAAIFSEYFINIDNWNREIFKLTNQLNELVEKEVHEIQSLDESKRTDEQKENLKNSKIFLRQLGIGGEAVIGEKGKLSDLKKSRGKTKQTELKLKENTFFQPRSHEEDLTSLYKHYKKILSENTGPERKTMLAKMKFIEAFFKIPNMTYNKAVKYAYGHMQQDGHFKKTDINSNYEADKEAIEKMLTAGEDGSGLGNLIRNAKEAGNKAMPGKTRN